MVDPNTLVVSCMEANAYYNAMSDKNRMLSNLAWMGAGTWLARSLTQSLIAEVYLMRAEELTKS